MEKTLIIGGGIAGLTAAYYLQQARKPFILVESQEKLGGRVQTDIVDGYRLDRGFQVFLTAYPEAQKVLDYQALQLRHFKPGAVILDGTKKLRIGDPLRDISSLFPTLLSGVGKLTDKVKILQLKRRLAATSIDQIFDQEEGSTRQALRDDYGFSQDMIDRFFAPFFRGIFLEDDLSTSRKMFDFVFKMFSAGNASIPAQGIGAISEQLARHIAKRDLRLGTAVSALEKTKAICADGTTIDFDQCIVAVDELNAAKLLGGPKPKDYASTVTAYYAADAVDLAPRLLHLLPSGLVNNLCDVTSLCPDAAPDGKRLLSLTLRGVDKNTDVDQVIRRGLRDVLSNVEQWRHIHTYSIQYALPDQRQVSLGGIRKVDNRVICGDYLHYGSLNAAMRSGRLAAEAILSA